MEIEFSCQKCQAVTRFETDDPGAGAVCAGCGETYAQGFADAAAGIHHCGICGCRDLYTQKDFNRKVGCGIAAVGAILAPFTKFISLLVCALIDLILYRVLPVISVCYRCGSIYREFPPNPLHEGFNLGINDRYRTEERKEI